MAKTKKGKKNSNYQKNSTKYKAGIQSNFYEEENASEELPVYEEEKEEHLIELDDDNQVDSTSYNKSFLEEDDFTEDEIEEYKLSLLHDEEIVKERLRKVISKKGKLNVVMIAEKPSIVKLISQALSNGQFDKEIWEGFQAYHFNNLKFKGFKSNLTVCSVYGNMYEYIFDKNIQIMKKNPIDILVNYPVFLEKIEDKDDRKKGK